jgi:hypothetical protein
MQRLLLFILFVSKKIRGKKRGRDYDKMHTL